MAAIDKDLYRQAQEWYRQWNVAERKARWEEAGKRSPQEAWEQYVDLWEFGWRTNVQPSQYHIRQKIESLERYYECVAKLEAWRRSRGSE
jgi:hypothetical protein